jgi:energy-coupling factor transport system permease protein
VIGGHGLRSNGGSRLPRPLHPLAWWAWALGLATAVSRTTNPLLLVAVLGVLGVVVTSRRSDAPWARAFHYYLVLALVVVGIRVGFRVVFGGGVAGPSQHVLLTLPSVPLPSWAAGVRLGGPVTLEAVLGALYDGLRLGTLLCCVGAANALANPKRALRLLPGALYELGVAVTVALSVAPQLVESVQRVHRARRLRGAVTTRRRAVARTVAVPVLEDALERSLLLAAAMDSRGYGRTGTAPRKVRRVTGALLVGGLASLCLGTYGLLDGTAPAALGIPVLVGGSTLCAIGMVVGGRRVRRTRYRPDPWRMPEWGVVALGVFPAAVLTVATAGLHPSTDPLAWPALPVLPTLAIAAAAGAAVVAPPRAPRAARAARQAPAGSPIRGRAPRGERHTPVTGAGAGAEVPA